MEKTIQITIASTIFQLTEAAYEKLSAYLASLKAHFAAEADSEEIMRDIESRIAEKLLEKKHKQIEVRDIDALVTEMGSASQFDTEESGGESGDAEKKGARKLYRDTDNAIIAGVASGIANYFNIDPILIRLAFILSVFFGGTGFVLYIILIFIIPEAKTASQKLEMRGHTVTLESISNMVKNTIQVEKERGTFVRIIAAPFKILAAVLRFLARNLFPTLGKLLGLVLAILSFFAILGLSLGLAITATNLDKPYMDIPFLSTTAAPLIWIGMGAVYLATLIPFVFISALGSRLLRGKSTLSSAVGFGLIGLWFLAVIATGVVATRIAGDYFAYTSISPEYQTVTETLDLAAFTNIMVEDASVKIVPGAKRSVVVVGRQMDMQRVGAQVVDGTLAITSIELEEQCLFCNNRFPTITITAPDIDVVKVRSGRVEFEKYIDEKLQIILAHSSVYGSITADELDLTLENSHLRARIDSETLSLNADQSNVGLEGSATNADITLVRSSMPSDTLLIENAMLSATQSYADLNVENSFDIERSDSSHIRNAGNATTNAR